MYFDTIGNFEGEYSFVTGPNVPLPQYTECRIPIELQEKIEAKIDEMVEQGIITSIMEPTEWVNSMIYPIKPNGNI